MSTREARDLRVVATNDATDAEATPSPEVRDAIAAALAGLRYGSLEIVIHDARVVQIIRTEKMRIER